MKNADAMALSLARAWARAGVRPPRDIVLAFTADEEDSAEFGSDFLVREHPELFEGCTEGISESGAFTFHAGPGMRLYPVAAGERGTAWLKLTAHGRAGHGSKVNHANAVSRLAAAVHRIGEHEWPVRLTPTVRAALVRLAELHELRPLSPRRTGRRGGRPARRTRPGRRTGRAGRAQQRQPHGAGGRLQGQRDPGDGHGARGRPHAAGRRGGVPHHARRALTGPQVDWEFQHREIPLQAPVDTPLFAAMGEALEHFDPGAHAVPHCMSGGTDAKQFSRLGIAGYGFTPLKLPEGFDYQALFHGVDERVPVEALHFGIRVLDRTLLGTAARSGDPSRTSATGGEPAGGDRIAGRDATTPSGG